MSKTISKKNFKTFKNIHISAKRISQDSLLFKLGLTNITNLNTKIKCLLGMFNEIKNIARGSIEKEKGHFYTMNWKATNLSYPNIEKNKLNTAQQRLYKNNLKRKHDENRVHNDSTALKIITLRWRNSYML